MAKPTLTNVDFCRAAKTLGCEVAAIKAFGEIESRGAGFDDQDRPTILFEHAQFRKYTGGAYDATYPDISSTRKGRYGPAAKQWDRFNLAATLNRHAAMLSISMGRFQCMGFNFRLVGYKSVEDFYNAMFISEGVHLDAFVAYITANHMVAGLRAKNWDYLALHYNGQGFKDNQYQIKLPAAYRVFAKENIDCSQFSAATPAPLVTTDNASPSVTTATDSSGSAVQSDPAPDPQTEAPPIDNTGDPAPDPASQNVLDTLGAKADKLTAWQEKFAKLNPANYLPQLPSSIETKLSVLWKQVILPIFSAVIGWLTGHWVEFAVIAGVLIILGTIEWMYSRYRNAPKEAVPASMLSTVAAAQSTDVSGPTVNVVQTTEPAKN